MWTTRCASVHISLRRSLSTSSSLRNFRSIPLDIHPEVKEALASKKPVVALETAVVTHGFPYPHNLELAISLENIVRSTGSIPATIGLIGGRVKVGLEKSELEQLADPKNHANHAKVSRRDIAPAIVMKSDGGTTCSATLIFAALAGIKVFATGGLGGVHRGGENSMDVSADLHELTRCPVGLVSSGVKSLLDIKRTLEYLETLGVPVLAYGKTRDFPAFFSPRSGYQVPWNVDNPSSAANILYTQQQLQMQNGALFAVPIPEEFEAAGAVIQKFVDQAVAESEANGISKRGNDVTPWLLNRIGELSEGKSLTSNIALLENSALVGGQIAVEYQKLANDHGNSVPISINVSSFQPSQQATSSVSDLSLPAVESSTTHPVKLVIVGSTAVDITAQTAHDSHASLSTHSTTPGAVSFSLGGVGRNMAEASHRVMTRSGAASTLLVSPIGCDPFGSMLVEETKKLGMRTDGLVQTDLRTAVCNMMLDNNGDLTCGVADMDITVAFDGAEVIPQLQRHRPAIVGLDGNLSPNTISSIVEYCHSQGSDVLFEPTSVIKSTAVLPSICRVLDTANTDKSPIAFSSPNLLELAHMYNASREEPLNLMSHGSWWTTIQDFSLGSEFRNDLERLSRCKVSDSDSSKGTLSFLVSEGFAQMGIHLLPFFQHLVVKCGSRGVLVIMRLSGKDTPIAPWIKESKGGRCVVVHGQSGEIVVLRHFPPLSVPNVVNVTGAGDSFVGALLSCLARRPTSFNDPNSLERVIDIAQRAAVLTLENKAAVSPLLSEMDISGL